MTEIITIILVFIILILGRIIVKRLISSVTIFDYEKGVRFHKGKFQDIVGAGKYTYLNSLTRLEVFDMRPSIIKINGQELLSADNVSVKISLAVKYEITDPQAIISRYENYHEYLYLSIQLKIREVISSIEMDEILINRKSINDRVKDLLFADDSLSGFLIHSVELKDIMLSADMKKVFAETVKVKKEALISLEKARGEMATLRSLANAAKMLEKNPDLMKLRLIQTMESSQGNTFIIDTIHHVREISEGK
jgi:regulator of protease activity HflC (stomatin/prohibitin superfamily)